MGGFNKACLFVPMCRYSYFIDVEKFVIAVELKSSLDDCNSLKDGSRVEEVHDAYPLKRLKLNQT